MRANISEALMLEVTSGLLHGSLDARDHTVLGISKLI